LYPEGPQWYNESLVKALDWFFLAASLALTIGTAWWVFSPSDAPLRVEVQDEHGTSVYPLNEDREISAVGPLGVTHVDILKGQVFVHDSPCTNHVCVAMGKISRGGQYVACLPNRVFVRVTGGAADPEVPDAGVW